MEKSIFLLLFTVAANMGLGIYVLSRKPRTRQNVYFFISAVFITFWAASSFLTDHAWSYDSKYVFAYMAFGGAFIAINALYWFSAVFRHNSNERIHVIGRFHWAVGVVGAGLSSTPLIVSGIDPQEGYTSIKTGPLYVLYVIILLGFFFLVARNMYIVIRHSPDQKQRSQARFMVFGTGVSFILILVSNAIFPALTGQWDAAAFGPPLTVFLVGSIVYAMFKHSLFNIKTAAARAITYLLSIVVLLALYGLVTYLWSQFALAELSLSTRQTVILSVITLVSALSFAPIKKFFDKLTTNIFYKDNYTAQDLIDDINQILVASTNLDTILPKVAQKLSEKMKVDGVTFVILSQTVTKSYGKSRPSKLVEYLIRYFEKEVSSLITFELFHTDRSLYNLLTSNNIAVAQKVYTTSGSLGWLLYGDKLNGDLYDDNDITVAEIIANESAIAIENALRFEQIEDFNINLQQKIDLATKELQRSNKKLQALDEAKDEFISMASHQLRTPLTSIKGYLSMVLEGDVGDVTDQQRQMLQTAFTSSQRMVYLIADLLNVSRLQTGKFMIETTDTYLPDVVEEELAQLKETAAAKNMTIHYDKPSAFPMMMLDETKIRQVIMNFADNAIYYTQNGGEVTVSLVEKPKSIEFTVTDNGMGVPKNEQHKLFNKFYRAGNARKARPDGTGLGLFMAKKVIVASGGALLFKSKEKVGSTFGFSFPKTMSKP